MKKKDLESLRKLETEKLLESIALKKKELIKVVSRISAKKETQVAKKSILRREIAQIFGIIQQKQKENKKA